MNHDHPRFSDVTYHPNIGGFAGAEDVVKCQGCGEPTLLVDRLHQFAHDRCETDSGYCAECRKPCTVCGDWGQDHEHDEHAEVKEVA